MVCSAVFKPLLLSCSNFTNCQKPSNNNDKKLQTLSINNNNKSHIASISNSVVPLIATVTLLLSSYPAQAGILSGFSGLESIPGPQLPPINFLDRFNEENQKKYAEADAKFKQSPIIKELLERSKLNKQKNKQEIADKYCLRGAEWGVGDCSAEGMTEEEKEKFIAMLKKKTGLNE
ncbi:hypothetical protein ACFE04_025314 [Oxalis oulophora]